MEPPGELIYSQMSFFGSSAASMSICAQMIFALSSFTSEPNQMMRSLSSRLKIGSVGPAGASSAAMTGRIALELLNLVSFGKSYVLSLPLRIDAGRGLRGQRMASPGYTDAAVRIVRAAASFTVTRSHTGAHASSDASLSAMPHARVRVVTQRPCRWRVRPPPRQLRKPPGRFPLPRSPGCRRGTRSGRAAGRQR